MEHIYSVVGLGKLGACMAAAIASRGAQVIGVDKDRRVVDLVNAGRVPTVETDLDQFMRQCHGRLSATLDCAEAVRRSEATFVVVPTPSERDGAFSLRYAAEAARSVGEGLARKSGYHLVVLTSTVLPGSTRNGLLPILEEASGKRCGRDFGLCYSPEFIALGSVIRDFLNPDFLLIGEFDGRSGAALETCYAGIVANRAPARRITIENAELAKIALNSYVTTKISFANMLADLCERIPGGDVDAVTGAIGFDSRIGRKYLTGALGYGGPCFPRDNRALSRLAAGLGTNARLAEAADEVNESVPGRILARLETFLRPGIRAAILGLAYKPATPIVEESQALEFVAKFLDAGASVTAHDPLAGADLQAAFGSRLALAASPAEALEGADVVVIALPDAAYRDLTPSDFDRCRPGATVLDCWRVLSAEVRRSPALRYLAVGRNQAGMENGAELLRATVR